MRKLLILIAGAVVAAACSSGGPTDAVDVGPGEAEVLFEPASSAGPDPFTDSVATTSITPETVAGVDAETAPGILLAGTAPGLYGGSGDQAVCDPDQLVAFLEANPDKAEAWAGVVGIEPAGIASYVDGLTPVVLLHDTQVTNHGFSDGGATPRQSVLEAGTAVMVDQVGVPRARCACGNPLVEPLPGPDLGQDVIAIVPGPVGPPHVIDVDTGETVPEPQPVDFCSIYVAMVADVGGGPSGPDEIEAYVARLADWLSQLVAAGELIPGFPPDAYDDLVAYQADAAAGPDAAGDAALRDRVEEFLQGYCENPPPPGDGTDGGDDDDGVPDGPVPDTNCGSFQFFLLIEIAEGIGLEWEPVGGTFLEQLTNFEADSLDDILTFEEIGCAGAQAMIEFLGANGIPNPFA